MTTHAYMVINLKRSSDRLAQLQQQFDRQNMAFTRIDAVDGKSLSQADIAAVYDGQGGHYHKPLNAGEIGCYLSHRRAWQSIVDNQLDFAIVLEDDITLTGDLRQYLTVLESMPNDWDYIKLAGHSRTRQVIHVSDWQGHQRVVYAKTPARTCAQAVSLDGARKLLANSVSIARPVDIDLQHWWEKDLRLFGLLPYLGIPNDALPSTINSVKQRNTAPVDRWLKWKNQWRFYWRNRSENKRRLAR
ncbi:glycosyltransferase family 25 protein [Alteromonas oceanisediminis]|uniref:glycosyltransferase family 25 protein n=1 Tax=Alteromonas oceanisediminis TaxID=2836180 RepID=UPI001BD96969|nr:glycosyltransferase family 25 protein [Alteromonas oceanisediminis]MBT0586744.1 glycosyltransferase family 25 protein [Alteromonas oceanisediminis]